MPSPWGNSMTIPRRAALAALASGAVGATAYAAAPATAPLRIGVLRFGSVSWELDVIRRHGFDAAARVRIEAVVFASAQATQVALQAHDVDMVVQDWLWVTRQRRAGAHWTFTPFSSALGAVVCRPGSPVHSLPDLRNRRLGIAGSPIDKSWLILRAYARRKYQLDLEKTVQKLFGAPPLLAEEMRAGRLDAVLTFWPFAAKAEADGMRRILAMDTALKGLGISPDVPLVGYVFSSRWARRHQSTLDGFLAAARQAQHVLATSDAEWQRLMPLTGAKNAAELDRLKAYYRSGIPRHWGPPQRLAAARLFHVLAQIGGSALIGPAHAIAQGTFWQPTAP